MNKHLLLSLLTVLTALAAGAYDFEYDGVCYSIISESEQTCEVANNPYSKYSGEIHVQPYLNHNGKVYTCTRVAGWAFDRCHDLTSVTLPETILEIGQCAFVSCDALTHCYIPPKTQTVGENAFKDCKSLPDATIPASVTSLGSGVFMNCSSLELVQWSTKATAIPDYAFYGCNSLYAFRFQPWVTSIGMEAFANTKLAGIVLPYGMQSVGVRAFWDCTAPIVVIPSSVTSIDSEAFGNCGSITHLYCNMPVPPAMNFNGVPSDAKLYVPTGKVHQYRAATGWNQRGTNVDGGAYDINVSTIVGYDRNACYHASIISNEPVTVDGVTYDGTAKYVFHPNVVTATTMPAAEPFVTDNMCKSGKRYLITQVGDSTFCSSSQSITTIDLSRCTAVTRLGAHAFWLSNAKVIKLPAGITEFGSWSLYRIYGLTDLYVRDTVPPAVPSGTFYLYDIMHTTLHVPTQEAVEAYKAADYWKYFYSVVTSDLRGDVNADDAVDTGDLSALIDHLLNGGTVNTGNADCDNSGTIDPADISALIDYLLNGTWGDEQQ